MSTLSQKKDFAIIISVKNANPNGDPLNGNRPREDSNGYGEISDVCIKRKIRNRLIDMGEKVFVQSDDYKVDEYKSLKDRADACDAIKKLGTGKNPDSEKYAQEACKEWIDVRSFGQVFAFKGSSVSVGVRGPVSISIAKSVSPIDVVSMQITKSVNSVTSPNGNGKSSDTMGMKHRVAFGLYVVYGSMNCQLAEKTGFTDEDSEKIKEAIKNLFENDCSSARPDGSMEVCRLYWWEHGSKTPKYSSAKVHKSLNITQKDTSKQPTSIDDYNITITPLEGLEPTVYDLT